MFTSVAPDAAEQAAALLDDLGIAVLAVLPGPAFLLAGKKTGRQLLIPSSTCLDETAVRSLAGLEAYASKIRFGPRRLKQHAAPYTIADVRSALFLSFLDRAEREGRIHDAETIQQQVRNGALQSTQRPARRPDPPSPPDRFTLLRTVLARIARPIPWAHIRLSGILAAIRSATSSALSFLRRH